MLWLSGGAHRTSAANKWQSQRSLPAFSATHQFGVLPSRPAASGFTLIELLIVIAIVLVLAAVSLPLYTSYVDRAKFTEVVSAIQPYKIAAEIAIQVEGAQMDELDAGKFTIPEATTPDSAYGEHLGSVDMRDGRITATAKNLLGEDNLPVSYILQARKDANGHVRWELDEQSTCLMHKLC